MQELDLRVVKLGIEVRGQIKTYEGLAITARGTKFANANQNESDITIYNLDKTTQDYILTETSPYNLTRTPKQVILEAGRKSYGTSVIYTGNIVSSRPSQPPDIGVSLKCLTGNFYNGMIISRSLPGLVSLKNLSQQIAADIGRTLIFQVRDRNLSGYAYTGSVLKQLNALNSISGISAFVDNANLIIKEIGLPRSDATAIVNSDTGMIGVPELTENGVRVKVLLNNNITLGGGMLVTSKVYPAANGNYVIYKLAFEISNRDVPFYWIAEGLRRE